MFLQDKLIQQPEKVCAGNEQAQENMETSSAEYTERNPQITPSLSNWSKNTETANKEGRKRSIQYHRRLQYKKHCNSNYIRRNIKEIHQLDIDGNLVATYESLKLAAITVGLTISSIRNIILGYSKTAAGYQWKAVYYQPGENKPVRKNGHPSRLRDEQEQEIKEFMEKVNGGTRMRRCIGIDDMDKLCSNTFLSNGAFERKCPKCRERQDGFLPRKLILSNNYRHYLQ